MNLVRIAAGGLTTSARGVSIDGDEVADLGDAFDAACDLLNGLLLLLRVYLAPDVGHTVVDLNVEAWYVQGTRVLADPPPDAGVAKEQCRYQFPRPHRRRPPWSPGESPNPRSRRAGRRGYLHQGCGDPCRR